MNLRERAAFAYTDWKRSEEGFLIDIAEREMRRVVKDDSLPLTFGDFELKDGGTVEVPVDAEGLTFKVVITFKTVSSSGSNQGLTYDEMKVKCWVFQTQWWPVEDLADVGKAFAGEPLPEIPEETQDNNSKERHTDGLYQ